MACSSCSLRLQCADETHCNLDECCLKTTYSHRSHYHMGSYCVPRPGVNQRCDIHFNYTCACNVGLVCTARDGHAHSRRDHTHHRHRTAHADEHVGVEEPLCGPDHSNWDDRKKFVCSTNPEFPFFLGETSMLQNQEPDTGSGTEPPTTALLTATQVVNQGGHALYCRALLTIG